MANVPPPEFSGFGIDVGSDDGPEKDGYGSQLPPSIYDKAPDLTLETDILPVIVGEDLTAVLKFHANMCNSSPLTVLRQHLAHAFNEGNFSCYSDTEPAKDEKRTGNDNNKQHKDNQQLKALIKGPNYNALTAHAIPAKISNIAALRRGCNVIFNTDEILAKVQQSEIDTAIEVERKRLEGR